MYSAGIHLLVLLAALSADPRRACRGHALPPPVAARGMASGAGGDGGGGDAPDFFSHPHLHPRVAAPLRCRGDAAGPSSLLRVDPIALAFVRGASRGDGGAAVDVL